MDNTLRSSQKFDSFNLGLYLFFYEFWKFIDLRQNVMKFPKEKNDGPDLNWIWADPAPTHLHLLHEGDALKWPPGWAHWSAAAVVEGVRGDQGHAIKSGSMTLGHLQPLTYCGSMIGKSTDTWKTGLELHEDNQTTLSSCSSKFDNQY
jgi:hypothetical protein